MQMRGQDTETENQNDIKREKIFPARITKWLFCEQGSDQRVARTHNRGWGNPLLISWYNHAAAEMGLILQFI